MMSDPIRLQRESAEKLRFRIRSLEDPTLFSVQCAVTVADGGRTRPSSWTAATWAGTAYQSGDHWYRWALTPTIGQGAFDLAQGTWALWADVDGTVGLVDTFIIE